MKYIQFIFLLLITFSCTKKVEKVDLPKNYSLEPEIQILVDSLSKIEYISDGKEQTIRYNSLVKKASINDLIFLTNNKNPYIRSFSFLALSQKNYPKIQSIFFLNIKMTLHL